MLEMILTIQSPLILCLGLVDLCALPCDNACPEGLHGEL